MKHRSFFWPLLLISAGVIWLLIEMNVIPSTNLWALGYVLPYFLIALGLGLIIRARWAAAGWIISAIIVAGAMLAVIFAPRLGWNHPLLGSLGASFSGGVAGSGKTVSETRPLGDFLVVSVDYPAEVVIRQSSQSSVMIEAEDNLLPQIGTEIRNGALRIANTEPDWTRRVGPSKPVKVTITVKDLKEIDLPSAGKLQVDGLKTDTLTIVLSGAGDIRLNKLQLHELIGRLSGAGNIQADGAAGSIQLIISGFGNFEAPELASTKADIRITGAGNATVRVSGDLTAAVSGAGSVIYYGSPRISQNISGAGSVRQAGQ